MGRQLIVAVVVLVGAGLVTAHQAHSKRAMPPKTEICNKTTGKRYVATMSYAGRGHDRTTGWSYLAAGTCNTFREDRYFVRGAKKVDGLDTTKPVQACVKNTKKFTVTGQHEQLSDKAWCDEQQGYLVNFQPPLPDTRTNTKPVVIRK